MGDIDLIPAAYRKRRSVRRTLRVTAVVSLLFSFMIVAAMVVLQQRAGQLETDITALQARKVVTGEQRAELVSLNERKGELQQQLDLLAGLRGGWSAQQLFSSMEQAVTPGRVWFTNWRFRRAGAKTDEDPETLDGSYFIVIRPGKPEQKEAWRIDAGMQIDGEAIDHAALSEFVSRLIDRPEIRSVHVMHTEAVRRIEHPLVRFSLDVVVAPGSGKAS